MKNKFKSFGFWTALAGALVVLANALGSAFGFKIDDQLITDIVMAVAGVLVVLGVVTMPKDDKTSDEDVQDEPEKNQDEKKDDE